MIRQARRWARTAVAGAAATLLVPLAGASATDDPAGAELLREITLAWNGDATHVPNGERLQASMHANLNYPHGVVVEGEENYVATYTVSAQNGVIESIPASCEEGSKLSDDGHSLHCALTLPEGDGLALTLDIPVRAAGPHGSTLLLSAADEAGNKVEAQPLSIEGAGLVDVVVSPTANRASHIHEVLGARTQTIVGFMVGVPSGGEALTGPIEVDLQLTAMSGFDLVDDRVTVGLADVAATTRNGQKTRLIAPHTDTYVLPDATIEDLGGGKYRVTIDSFADINAAGLPSMDGVGDPLSVLPVASVGLLIDHPVNGNTVNENVTFSMEVTGVRTASASGPITEQVDVTNDSMSVSVIPSGGRSANWSTGGAPVDGGVWATLDTIGTLAPDTAELVDLTVGTGVLVGAADMWTGAGAVLPGDSLIASVENGSYLGANPADLASGNHGICLVFDSPSMGESSEFVGKVRVAGLSDYTMEFLEGQPVSGGFATPNCTAGEWSDDFVSAADVSAIRVTFDPSQQDNLDKRVGIFAGARVSQSRPEGDLAWMTGTVSDDGGLAAWSINAGRVATVGGDYGTTTLWRDAVVVGSSRTIGTLRAVPGDLVLGETATWTHTTHIHPGAAGVRGEMATTVEIVLPAGVDYVQGSASVTETSLSEDGRVLAFDHVVTVGEPASITFDTIHTGTTGTYEATATVTNHDATLMNVASSRALYTVSDSGSTYLVKDAAAREFATNGSNEWTLSVTNREAEPQEIVDIIDVLPHSGDQRGTAMTGEATVVGVAVGSETSVWATDADPASIDVDPDAISNGGLGTPSELWREVDLNGGGDIWQGMTAIRFVSHDVMPGEERVHTISYDTTGMTSGDKLVNSAQARATGTVLSMVKSMDTAVVGDPASLQVDKFTVTEPANIAPGGVITYQVSAHSAGPGTVRGATLVEAAGDGLTDAVFAEVSVGEISPDGRIWYIGDLAEGEVVTATVEARVVEDAQLDVTNYVWGGSCPDGACEPPQPTECVPNNDVYSDTDSCDVVVDPLLPAFLAIDKQPGVIKGGVIEHVIQVGNLGERTIHEVTMTELPGVGLEQLEFLEVSVGETSGATWSVGTLKPGEVQTTTVRVALDRDATGQVTNQAFVRGLGLEHGGGFEANVSLVADTDQGDTEVTELGVPSKPIPTDRNPLEAEPTRVASPPRETTALPRAGVSSASMVLGSLGLVVLGLGAVASARRRW